MPRLFLPAEHSDADIILASQIADAVDSAELFVTWSTEAGRAAPEIQAELREPRHPFTQAIRLFARMIAELWRALTGRRARA